MENALPPESNCAALFSTTLKWTIIATVVTVPMAVSAQKRLRRNKRLTVCPLLAGRISWWSEGIRNVEAKLLGQGGSENQEVNWSMVNETREIQTS